MRELAFGVMHEALRRLTQENDQRFMRHQLEQHVCQLPCASTSSLAPVQQGLLVSAPVLPAP